MVQTHIEYRLTDALVARGIAGQGDSIWTHLGMGLAIVFVLVNVTLTLQMWHANQFFELFLLFLFNGIPVGFGCRAYFRHTVLISRYLGKFPTRRIRLTIDDRGIYWHRPDGDREIPWENILDIVRSGNIWLIYLERHTAACMGFRPKLQWLVIPHRKVDAVAERFFKRFGEGEFGRIDSSSREGDIAS